METILHNIKITVKDISQNDDEVAFKCFFNNQEFIVKISDSLSHPLYHFGKNNYKENINSLNRLINDKLFKYLNREKDEKFIEISLYNANYFWVKTASCPEGFKVFY